MRRAFFPKHSDLEKPCLLTMSAVGIVQASWQGNIKNIALILGKVLEDDGIANRSAYTSAIHPTIAFVPTSEH